MSDPRSVILSGPAVPETLRVFRSVASSVAASSGMTVECIDEFKIAIDEGATLLLRTGEPTRLEIGFTPKDNRVIAVIRSDISVGDWPGSRVESWPWRVIQSLTVEPRFSSDPSGIQISFAKALGT
jgi:hypothetical protein